MRSAPRPPTTPNRQAPFLVRVYREWWRDEVPYLASALTFDALAAAVPFMMLLLTLVGVLVTYFVPEGELDLRSFLSGAFPASRMVDLDPLLRVERLLEGVADRRVTVSAVSVPLLFILSTRMFATVRWGLDRVFDAVEPRKLGHRWLVDVVLVFVTGACLMANGIASIGLAVLAAIPGVQGLAQVGGATVTFVSALGLFVAIFRLAPGRRIDWPTALVAAVCSATFFEGAKLGFALYLEYAVKLDALTPDAQLAGIMLLLAWFYLNALAFLTAGEVANEYSRHKQNLEGVAQSAEPIALA